MVQAEIYGPTFDWWADYKLMRESPIYEPTFNKWGKLR